MFIFSVIVLDSPKSLFEN